jgi:hypothetical protein
MLVLLYRSDTWIEELNDNEILRNQNHRVSLLFI